MKYAFLALLLSLNVLAAEPATPAGDWLPVLVAPDGSSVAPSATPQSWQNPITKLGKLNSPLVEVTPFTFKERLYLLENWQQQWEHPGIAEGSLMEEDEIRIRDLETNEIISVALRGHGLGSALVHEGRVYVFSGNWGTEKKWRIKQIEMTSSEDLIHWTEPQVILNASETEHFFNVSVCRGADRFYLLVESDDPQWPAFTFKYFESPNLTKWTPIPGAVYGREKYVGGPAFYYFDGIFYTLYLESLGEARYETRITRSKDLIHWQDAPKDRPFVTFDPSQRIHPLRPADLREQNASDVELCAWQDKTILYFTGGDQQICGDLQRAEFNGTPQALLEHFFEEPIIPMPVARQQHYQENQLGAFVHFGPATWNESEFLETPPASVFNPTDLDAAQWCRAAKSFGARHIVLTAKHHNGFCLWPTETTDYSVRTAPWKAGGGDVVREFVDAARAEGIEPGLYISAADFKFPCTSTPDPLGQRKLRGDRNAYFPIFFEQLRELLTNYGPLAVIWFDGAYDPFGWDVSTAEGLPLGPSFGDALATMIHQLQPDAVIFNGTRPDVRWSGSEQGQADYPLWNTVRLGEGVPLWVPPYFAGWALPEAVLHTRATWFWTPNSDNTLRSVEDLMGIYHNSIGRGANLLVNLTPDTTGLVPAAEVQRMQDFGTAITDDFAKPLAQLGSEGNWFEANTLELPLGDIQQVSAIVLEEDLSGGQRVRQYRVEAKVGESWQVVAEGQTIGRKHIQRFTSVATGALRLRITETEPLPRIRTFAAY